jgi:hypothetical protein
MKKRFGFKIVGMVVMVLTFVFGLSAIVMYLWNYALVPTLELNPLGYWQAMAILVLSKILFTGLSPRKPGGPWKERWKGKYQNMSDEERQVFRDRWKRRCGPEEKKLSDDQ